MRLALGEGLELRPVRAGDAEELHALAAANREHLRPWMPWAVDLRPAATQAFVEGAVGQAARDEGLQAVIVERGAIIGSAGHHRVDGRNRSTSVGYWLAATHQGRGIATAAVRALCAHAFETRDLHRVELHARPDNVRSRAVAERLGFTREGLRREAEHHDGRFYDLVLYALLATDARR